MLLFAIVFFNERTYLMSFNFFCFIFFSPKKWGGITLPYFALGIRKEYQIPEGPLKFFAEFLRFQPS